ncbi:hypothetical protein TNCV_207991 [Trichonephila clavipes]|uniref:Uncharacterized protein n=1 Tax=Trichonephila clavipes TaxID=2585209 RepID=A0A8X6VIP2_TRICX|nr:hypothetical protein TNCV_207991 [Trichonephila clavipes]
MSSVHRFLLHQVMIVQHHSCKHSTHCLISLKAIPIGYFSTTVEFRNLVKRRSGRQQLTQQKKSVRKTIAVLPITNPFPTYLALACSAAVALKVRLRYNADNLHIS